MEQKDYKFEIKQLTEDGTFEGYLSVFNVVDSYGDLVEKGAFKKTLSEQKEFPLLWSHNMMEPIGSFTAEEDEYGLKIKGALNLDIPKAREVYSNIKKRIIKGLSIGYDSIQKLIDEGIRRLKELKLWEGSLCLFPACEKAVVTSVKSVIEALNIELKEGRVISKANLALISKAIEALTALLEAAQPADATGKSEEPPEAKDKPDSIHLSGIKEELNKLRQLFMEVK